MKIKEALHYANIWLQDPNTVNTTGGKVIKCLVSRIHTLQSQLPSTAARQKQAIREYLNNITDVSGLPCSDFDDVVEACEEVLLHQAKYTGVMYEVELGRDCRDHRCYALHEVMATNDDYPEIRLESLLRAVKPTEVSNHD